VVADFEAGRLAPLYRGQAGELADLPRPARHLFDPRYRFASVQTSRGCPMDCDFCSVSAFNGRRYRRRPHREVLDELESIPHDMLFFVDDNILGSSRDSRQQARKLFEGMVERGIRKHWFCQASLNFADDEDLLRWAARAGCRMVFLGLEADEVDALSSVNKRLNLRRGVASYEEAFRRIHRAGISVLGAFIFGLDGDTPEKLRRRTDYMIRSGIDVMQTTFLTPLPGTRQFDRYQEQLRLLYPRFPRDWDHYDMTEVTHHPQGMTADELKRATHWANRRLYSWPVLIRKGVQTFLATRSPSAAVFAWMSNLNYRRVVSAIPGAAGS
jgi:radical SAM superfamily enzyme YgiQ (UPF0313 family)